MAAAHSTPTVVVVDAARASALSHFDAIIDALTAIGVEELDMGGGERMNNSGLAALRNLPQPTHRRAACRDNVAGGTGQRNRSCCAKADAQVVADAAIVVVFNRAVDFTYDEAVVPPLLAGDELTKYGALDKAFEQRSARWRRSEVGAAACLGAELVLGEVVWNKWRMTEEPRPSAIVPRKLALAIGRLAHGVIARAAWPRVDRRTEEGHQRPSES